MRKLFPYVYLVLAAVLVVPVPTFQRALLLGLLSLLALILRPTTALALGRLVVISALSLVPFVAIVQWAICSAQPNEQLAACIVDRSSPILVRVLLAASILLIAAANEWRGSLTETANGLNVPRTVKVMLAISGALIGEFRKAIIRVHHAFTARGDALPSISLRNLFALPRMSAVIWASVLMSVSGRLDTLWASDAFWARAMPVSGTRALGKATLWRDLLVLFAVALTLLTAVMAAIRA